MVEGKGSNLLITQSSDCTQTHTHTHTISWVWVNYISTTSIGIVFLKACTQPHTIPSAFKLERKRNRGRERERERERKREREEERKRERERERKRGGREREGRKNSGGWVMILSYKINNVCIHAELCNTTFNYPPPPPPSSHLPSCPPLTCTGLSIRPNIN